MGILFALVLVSAVAARGEDQVARPTPPPFYRDKLDLLHWLDDRGQRQPVRTIDLLQSLAEVDGQQIGVIGHSLGGHNSLFLAAYDERVRCVVSCCGYGTNEEYVKKHKFTGGEGVRYYPRIKDADQRRRAANAVRSGRDCRHTGSVTIPHRGSASRQQLPRKNIKAIRLGHTRKPLGARLCGEAAE